ncbi:hypothetical protein KAT51_00960 [bacterium]|nr:hypothetical protein [bacterium]
MAVDSLKDFGVMFILAGLLFLSLLTFAIGFTSQNNPDALGTSEDRFDKFKNNFTSTLISTEEEGNELLNISAESDPEVSNLGSRDSVATSYGIAGNSGGFFNIIRQFFEWVIPGSDGVIIMSVLGGIFAFLLAYFVTKWIRNGI